METKTEKISSFSLILYSSLLILVFETLLSKVSYQLYAMFVPLPFLFIGLVVSFVNFSITIFVSLLINLLLNIFFPEKFIPTQFIVFNLSISVLSLLFFLPHYYFIIIYTRALLTITSMILMIFRLPNQGFQTLSRFL